MKTVEIEQRAWTGGVKRVNVKEGMRNIIKMDLNIRHEVVRVWWRRKNKTRIIQCEVVSKSLSEEFSLRDRGGAIWVKKGRER